MLQLRFEEGRDVITADHAICICDDLIFDSNSNAPMNLNLTNLNKCCMNVTKPSCKFGAVTRGWIFEEKIIQTRVFSGRPVRANSTTRLGASTRRKRKRKNDASNVRKHKRNFKDIIDNIDSSTEKSYLQLLSKSFEKCAQFYPNDTYLKASQEILSRQNFNVFDIKESFLTRKGYGFHIVKNLVGIPHILYGIFDVPTLMLISIDNIFDVQIYDIIVLSRGEIFTSCFESGVQRNEQNIAKYMESQNCDDFQRLTVLRTLSFYGKTVKKHGSKFRSRFSRVLALEYCTLSRILEIDTTRQKVFEYTGYYEGLNASEDISLMIKRKRGLISLKKDYDLSRHRASRRNLIEADKAASERNVDKERIYWDSLDRLLHQFFLNYEKEKKEIQDHIISFWEQSKDKICLALYLEDIPLTTKGILLLNERYMNNFSRYMKLQS